MIQINGKVRAKINIDKSMPEEEIERLVVSNPVVQKWVEGKRLTKKVFVKDRPVNFVADW